MAIELTRRDTGWSLTLTGTVAAGQAGLLHRLALEAAKAPREVTVDLTGLEFLDTSAAQVLLALGREAAERGVDCHGRGASPRVAAMLRLAGLDALLGPGR